MKKLLVLPLAVYSHLTFAGGDIGGGTPPAFFRGGQVGGGSGGYPISLDGGSIGGGTGLLLFSSTLEGGTVGGVGPSVTLYEVGGSSGTGTPPAFTLEGGSMGGGGLGLEGGGIGGGGLGLEGGTIGGTGTLEFDGGTVGGGSGSGVIVLADDKFRDIASDAFDDGLAIIEGQRYVLKAIDSLERPQALFLLKAE